MATGRIAFVEGLRLDADPAAGKEPLRFGSGATVPTRVDNRLLMLGSSDQGSTPKCAAYSMAGVLEFMRWRDTGVAAQQDPDPIYSGAKEIDNLPGDGTTLESVLDAAVYLRLVPQPKLKRTVLSGDIRRAIHRYGVVLAGFKIRDGWTRAKSDGWVDGGGSVLGGHAVVLCGYSDVSGDQWIAAQNSWGDQKYGWRGFLRMSWETFAEQFMYGLIWE